MTRSEQDAAARAARLAPAAPELRQPALEACIEADRAAMQPDVHADIAILGNDRMVSRPARLEACQQAGRLRRALEQPGPGPIAPVDPVADQPVLACASTPPSSSAGGRWRRRDAGGGKLTAGRRSATSPTAARPWPAVTAARMRVPSMRAAIVIPSSGDTRRRNTASSTAMSRAARPGELCAQLCHERDERRPGQQGLTGEVPGAERARPRRSETSRRPARAVRVRSMKLDRPRRADGRALRVGDLVGPHLLERLPPPHQAQRAVELAACTSGACG